MSNPNEYENPLISRYASVAMSGLWSPQRKIGTWRRLWVALAEAEAELGLPITARQIAELRAHVDDIDFEAAARYERRLRHDVMAHVHAYGDACPEARPIIHLGATSCYVTDNTDLLLAGRVAGAGPRPRRRRDPLAWPSSPASTAIWPAWPIPISSRRSRPRWASGRASGPTTSSWTSSRSSTASASSRPRAARAPPAPRPASSASSTAIMPRSAAWRNSSAARWASPRRYPVTGQTYSRKIDAQVMAVLSGVAQSATRWPPTCGCWPIARRLEEPFEEEQIGSSAMAYKRNPMRCERICSLARFVMSLESGAAQTAGGPMAGAHAGRQRHPPADPAAGLPGHRRGADPLPERGRRAGGLSAGDRRHPGGGVALHGHGEHPHGGAWRPAATGRSCTSGFAVTARPRPRWSRSRGATTISWTRLAADPAFGRVDLAAILQPRQFIGRAPEQVDEFLAEVVDPLLARYPEAARCDAEVRV